MKKVWLIPTVHHENGLANSHSLHALLMSIQPEVIFFEFDAEDFKQNFGAYSQEILEVKSALQYQTISRPNVEFVPVDSSTPDASMSDFVIHNNALHEHSSEHLRKLMQMRGEYIYKYGFEYLYSDECIKITTAICDEELGILHRLGDQKLIHIQEKWERRNLDRERGMVKRIDSYCEDHSFERAVFLVGAAHRRSIIEIISTSTDLSPQSIDWHLQQPQI